MRIVMDTGDLRNLASVARDCARTVGVVNGDVRRAHHSVNLNTRDDATLRRHRPHDIAGDVDRELRRLEDDYAGRARRYEQRARLIERAERIPWRPLALPILIGPAGGQWRIPHLPNLPDPGSVLRPLLPIRPPALPILAPSALLAVRRAPSLLEQGVGLISRGINAIRRGFADVTDRIVDTVAGAWTRIWNRTNQVLRSVVDGLRNIVVFGAQIAVDGYRTITTTVGRWVTGAAHTAWAFLGKTWDLVSHLSGYVFTVLDLREIVKFALTFDGLINFFGKMTSAAKIAPRYLGRFWWIGTVVGGIDAIAQFVEHGAGDARFWRSLFEVVGGLGAMIAAASVGIPAAFGAIALGIGMYIGTQISNIVFMPFINRHNDNIPAEKTAPAEGEVEKYRTPAEPPDSPEPHRSTDYDSLFTKGSSWAADWELTWRDDKGNAYDQWSFGYDDGGRAATGNCTSFVAWRLNQLAKAAGFEDFSFDNNRVVMSDGSTRIFKDDGGAQRLGDARKWIDSAARAGIEAQTKPSVGSVLVWEADDGKGSSGHVAIVREVLSDGSIVIEQSAWDEYTYKTETLTPGSYPEKFLNFLPEM